jgi:N-acetylglucosamine kinase-like BadF-type ATPase
MTFVIGVDGGGTHARAVLIDQDGQELARGEAAGAVVRVAAPAAAARAVGEAVRTAAARAGVGLPGAVLWAGLAGAGSPDARLGVEKELEGAGIAERIVVGTDVEAAFHGAFGTGPGILLISGTGSIAWARTSGGAVVRVGGWGERLGDEGSGFAIGSAALRAVARAQDGRGPSTTLTERVLAQLALESVDALIPWKAGADKADVARLVPLVSKAATEGDEVARDVLSQAVRELCDHLAAALERGGPWPEPPELVLAGGLLADDGALHGAMSVAASAYPVRLSPRRIDPALGAAKLALAELAAR